MDQQSNSLQGSFLSISHCGTYHYQYYTLLRYEAHEVIAT